MRLQISRLWAATTLADLLIPAWSQQVFDPREATISSVHNALYSGVSCRTIISAFISRIEALDHAHTNAIISLDPDSISIASQHDALLASKNGTLGPLFCVPVLLKDNIDTASQPTTGGSLALADSRPTVDALVVQALKDAGAIILGKTNLQELALEGISVSSLGGQTINPYDDTRTPGGSSGGSGAAIAASFAVLSLGTDTMNSLRSPASANGLFSLRPTRGLVPRVGVIPVSHTQDAVGPIARCVEDLAITLSVIAGTESHSDDNSTALVPPGIRKTDYYSGLDSGSLEGKRIGVIESFFDRTPTNETTPVNEAMEAVMESLKEAGVTLVPIQDDRYSVKSILSLCDTQLYELRQEMDNYLSRSNLAGRHPESLEDLYGGEHQFLVLPAQYEFIKAALRSSTENTTSDVHRGYAEVKNNIQDLISYLHRTFASNELDGIIYPQQRNLAVKIGSASQHGRSGILAAVTGFPSMALPGGFSHATENAPVGIPIGFELMGLPWTEGSLLQMAYNIQHLMNIRKSPSWAKQSIPIQSYDVVPSIMPNALNVPSAYPLGTL